MTAGGPFRSAAAGCGGYTSRGPLHPVSCQSEPTWSGLVYTPFPLPGVAAWAFACSVHRYHLVGARELLDRDREELARRRKAWNDSLNGAPWVRTPPLATGKAARDLIRRAKEAAT